jgi:hypothetical protein
MTGVIDTLRDFGMLRMLFQRLFVSKVLSDSHNRFDYQSRGMYVMTGE